jgi:hypothetical protein
MTAPSLPPGDATGLMIGTVVSVDEYVKNSETLRWLQRKFWLWPRK